MKNAYVPLAWFVILGSMLAAASGLSLVLVMRYRPSGLWPSPQRQREIDDTQRVDAPAAMPVRHQ